MDADAEFDTPVRGQKGIIFSRVVSSCHRAA